MRSDQRSAIAPGLVLQSLTSWAAAPPLRSSTQGDVPVSNEPFLIKPPLAACATTIEPCDAAWSPDDSAQPASATARVTCPIVAVIERNMVDLSVTRAGGGPAHTRRAGAPCVPAREPVLTAACARARRAAAPSSHRPRALPHTCAGNQNDMRRFRRAALGVTWGSTTTEGRVMKKYAAARRLTPPTARATSPTTLRVSE